MKLRTMFVTVMLVCLLVSSCSANLTRGKAEEIIRSTATFPSNGTVDEFYLYWESYCFQRRVEGLCGTDAMSDGKKAMSEGIKALQSSGLITVTFEGATSRIALTEKGRQYAVGAPSDRPGNNGNGEYFPLSTVMVVKTTVDFGTITGIIQVEESKSARVEYTLIVTPTPFGIADGLAPETVRQTAVFTKYDDGWRIGQ